MEFFTYKIELLERNDKIDMLGLKVEKKRGLYTVIASFIHPNVRSSTNLPPVLQDLPRVGQRWPVTPSFGHVEQRYFRDTLSSMVARGY